MTKKELNQFIGLVIIENNTTVNAIYAYFLYNKSVSEAAVIAGISLSQASLAINKIKMRLIKAGYVQGWYNPDINSENGDL